MARAFVVNEVCWPSGSSGDVLALNATTAATAAVAAACVFVTARDRSLSIMDFPWTFLRLAAT
ncbi:hypothetical protein [Cryobacterium sp. Y29]|uniref:hypothetical protein n=1 Tax=Cryobacterium sp. Y29 TaxID=2048285 RepID=UPI0011B00AA6|nr:hypothetical protein [Cryobacterium sp. Y29]